jgi:hypothetical protein
MEIDFEAHNAEASEVWQAYQAGKPVRVPVSYALNARSFLLDPGLNTEGISFESYINDAETMLQVQLRFEDWRRQRVVDDGQMGLPPAWPIRVDLQNFSEAAWLGAEVRYYADQVPDTAPLLAGERKNLLFDRGIPEPLGGIMETNLSHYEYLKARQASGYEYKGRALAPPGIAGAMTDGCLTVATSLRGHELYLDFYEDPDYVRRLLSFITEATVKRIKALRARLGQPEKTPGLLIADDSVALLSTEMYREFVLPEHLRLVAALSEGGPNQAHLCGDAQRHFPDFKEKLNVNGFDTGFPIDFGWVRRTLGPEVTLRGGPTVKLFREGRPEELEADVKRILETGVTEGGRFILGEANNMAPRTPTENMRAGYEAVRKYGRYS